MQQGCGLLTDAVNLDQVADTRIKNGGQAPELAQQPVTDSVGISPGYGIEQDQFQYLVIFKMVDAFTYEALAQALPMARMRIGIIHDTSM